MQMVGFILIWLEMVFTVKLQFKILIETSVFKLPEYEYSVIENSIKEYNNELSEYDIELVLQGYLEYSKYSHMEGFRDLIKYTGTENIRGRIESLEAIDTNIIMLASLPNEKDTTEESIISPCRSRYIFNIALHRSGINDRIGMSILTIKNWIKDLFWKIHTEKNYDEAISLGKSLSKKIEICNLYSEGKKEKSIFFESPLDEYYTPSRNSQELKDERHDESQRKIVARDFIPVKSNLINKKKEIGLSGVEINPETRRKNNRMSYMASKAIPLRGRSILKSSKTEDRH